MNAFLFLFARLSRFKKKFWVLAFAGIVDGIITFTIPLLLALATRQKFSVNEATVLILQIIGLYLFSHVLQWVLRRYAESLGPEFALDLRLRYFDALADLSIPHLVKHHSGYLLSLVGRVSDGLSGILVDLLWGLSRSIAHVTLFLIVTARHSVLLAVMNLLILSFFVSLSKKLSAMMVPLVVDGAKRRSIVMGTYADFGSALPTIKRLGITEFSRKHLSIDTEYFIEQTKKVSAFHANRWFLLHSLYSIAMVSTTYYLLIQVANDNISISTLILFTAAFATIKLNADRLSESFRMMLEISGYIEALEELVPFREAGEISTANNLTEEWDTISAKGLIFIHEGTSTPIEIESFEIARGDKIFISGRSGEGKTTLLNLIARMLIPTTGELRLDGVCYEDLPKGAPTNLIAFASQDADLFHLSVRDNLSLGKNIEDSILITLLDEVGLHDWLKELGDGLNTIIGERGMTVSQGQRQRINLLRAYLLDREIYLLDEPTAHLDPDSTAKVIKFVRDRLANKTMLVVSHSEELRSNCPREFVIREHRLFAVN